MTADLTMMEEKMGTAELADLGVSDTPLATNSGLEEAAEDLRRTGGATGLAAEPSCAGCRFFQAQFVRHAPTTMGKCRLNPGGILVESFAWCSHHEERPIRTP